jgi:hypothetical protein
VEDRLEAVLDDHQRRQEKAVREMKREEFLSLTPA